MTVGRHQSFRVCKVNLATLKVAIITVDNYCTGESCALSSRSVAELDIGTNPIPIGRRARALKAGARPEKGEKVSP